MAEPRPANQIESEAWESFKRYYETILTPAVKRAKQAAEIAYQGQQTISQQNVPGFVFDTQSQAAIDSVLNRYNMIGRYILDIESGRYFIRLQNGDIDILASQKMAFEDYQVDMWPSLGVAPILWALAVGVVLVGSLWAVSKALEAEAKKEEERNEARLIEADREMLKQPEPVRKAWIDYRQKMQAAVTEPGLLSKFFGTQAATTIGGAIAAAVLLVGLGLAFSKRKA